QSYSHYLSHSPTPHPPSTSPLSLHDALPISFPKKTRPILVETFRFSHPQPRPGESRDPLILRSSGCWVGPGFRRDGESRGLPSRSEEHTSELQSRSDLVCRLLLVKKKQRTQN